MIREKAAMECAESIIEPILQSGGATRDIIPIVARIILLAVKQDELAQEQERLIVQTPRDYANEV